MLLVVGWDGACLEVLEPLLAAGRLPTLAGLLADAAVRPVTSTVPAATFPAWTSFVTAASPGRHGVTDFTVRDGYGLRFLNASHRRIPGFWALVGAEKGPVGVYALPVTYPPEPFNGLLVCGFDTPLGAARLGARTWPPSLASEIEARYGTLAVGGPSQARIGAGWHDCALAAMTQTIAQRTRIVTDLLRDRRFECFLVHYGESDTVAHQFWHLSDRRSPRFSERGPADAIGRVYEALDAALADLLEASGPHATVMLISDHGSGGTSDRAVFWNRWLCERGYLGFHETALGALALRLGRAAALRWVPPRWQASLLGAMPDAAARVESGARLGGIDWARTKAFSEELTYFPSLWLNLEGREPRGSVAREEVDDLIARLTGDLLAFRDPLDGIPVVERVLRRDEVAAGPYSEHVPDLVLELRHPQGYSYAAMSSRAGEEAEPVRVLRADERTGARGTSMGGSHRADGLCVLAGPRVQPGRYRPGTLPDAGATLLALCGCAPHRSADGLAWRDCLDLPGPLAETTLEVTRPPDAYTGDEEALVAERLRALGYLS
jgi:predicted AlkP superfamily phosphohydrolase/phosphomutase